MFRVGNFYLAKPDSLPPAGSEGFEQGFLGGEQPTEMLDQCVPLIWLTLTGLTNPSNESCAVPSVNPPDSVQADHIEADAENCHLEIEIGSAPRFGTEAKRVSRFGWVVQISSEQEM